MFGVFTTVVAYVCQSINGNDDDDDDAHYIDDLIDDFERSGYGIIGFSFSWMYIVC